jgi:hypothetical protein
MSRRAIAEARRAWRAATAAREKAEAAFARAEAEAERARGDDQWDAQCEAHTAHARLEEAKAKENTAEDEYLHLLSDRRAPALIAREGR